MERITKNKLITNAYNNIYDTVNNRSNIADPRDPQGLNIRDFIYDSDPFEKGLNFNGMPYIVLFFPTIEQMEQSVNGKHRIIMWTQRILVRTVRDGSSGASPITGRTDLFNITDDLFETFNKKTVKDNLANNFMNKLTLTQTDTRTDNINEREIYESELELTYMQRIEVSE